MKDIFAVSAILFCLSLAVSSARASFITLNTSMTSSVESNDLRVTVASVNRGDESAHNVQAELRVGDRSVLGCKSNAIPVNESYSAEFRVPTERKTAGVYPFAVIIHYTDANQYPFSAVAMRTFVLGKETVSPVFGQAKAAKLWATGMLDFTLKNLADREIRATARLMVPRELAVAENAQALILGPKEEACSSFAVTNFAALQGSSYQVYVVLEFDDNGMHHTSIAPGTIAISESVGWGGTNRFVRILVFTVLAFLIVFFVGAQFKRK